MHLKGLVTSFQKMVLLIVLRLTASEAAIVESFYTLFFFVAVLSPLPSIFSALLEDSKKVSFQRGFARYLLTILSTCAASQNFHDLGLLRVPVQGVNILVVLGEIAINIKNNGIRQ